MAQNSVPAQKMTDHNDLPPAIRSILKRAFELVQNREYDRAREDFNDVLAHVPTSATAFCGRGNTYLYQSEFEKAIGDYDAAIKLEPSFARAFFYRGQALFYKQQTAAALNDINHSIKLEPEPDFYFYRGWFLYELKRYDEAVADYDRCIAKNSETADLYFRRGCALYHVGDYESAILDFNHAARHGVEYDENLHWRGRALENIGDLGAAITDFSDVIDRDSNASRVLIDRGRVRLKLLDIPDAIADFSRAINLSPNEVRAWTGRGRAFWTDGDSQRALKELDEALQIDPHFKKALRLRSQIYVECGDFANAESDLDMLENLNLNSQKEDPMSNRRTRISMLLAEHFAPLPVGDLAITERQFPFRVRVDLQNAVNDLFAEEISIEHFSGVKVEHAYETTSFSSLLFPSNHRPPLAVPVEYEEVDIGEDEPARCMKNGLWLLAQGAVKYAVLLSPNKQHGTSVGLQFQIAVPAGEAGEKIARTFFLHLENAVAKSDSYRGKILSLELSAGYTGMSSGIRVHKLRTVERDQVILPEKTLDLLERNMIQFAKQRDRLNQLGLSTKKGLLFYGPPGTGKTHTIHYLAKAMEGHTTLLIAAEQIGLLSEYMTLARLLQPSIVVIEDADLIARERSQMDSVCEEVLLNKLLNEMDGLRPDTDIFFVLTTNRPEALEAALASRPGRIDQAIEFPAPDEEGRTKLIMLYAKQLNVPQDIVATAVKRTDGVSASFIKELMRRAAQFYIERDGDGALVESDIDSALQELLFSGGTFNGKLLGMERATS